jgi:hypothetical protein
MTARTPEDLLAMVPCVLGFHPEQSVVMLTFGASTAFHARIDLPACPEEIDDVVEALVEPACRNRVEAVVLVVYGPDLELVSHVMVDLEYELEAQGIHVIEMLRVDGDRWFGLRGHLAFTAPEGVPFAVDEHEFLVQSVFEGRVTHQTREDLADSLVGTDVALLEEVEALAFEAATRWPGVQMPAEALWVRDTVVTHVEARSLPDAGELGRLLVALQDIELRDVAWSLMSRDNAAAHVDFWRGVVRRTPSGRLAPSATLLAFAAWLSGHGALAWCAVDRAVLAEPDYSLARHVTAMLTHAVPPTVWEQPTGSPLLASGE